MFYRSMKGSVKAKEELPNKANMETFWKWIWSNAEEHEEHSN